MKTPRCYCDQAPRDTATGQRRFACNVCVDAIVDEKNRLVRQEQDFPARLAAAKAEGVRKEGERLLGRIREVIASWEGEPRDANAGIVVAAFKVFSACITHRGVTREAALDAGRKRLEDERATRCATAT